MDILRSAVNWALQLAQTLNMFAWCNALTSKTEAAAARSTSSLSFLVYLVLVTSYLQSPGVYCKVPGMSLVAEQLLVHEEYC